MFRVVGAEEFGEFDCLGVVGGCVIPNIAWVKDVVWYTFDSGWHVESKDWVLDGIGIVE